MAKLNDFSIWIETVRKMNFIMFRIRNYQEIFNRVVNFVSINVVNMFISLKNSSQLFTHQISMFFDITGMVRKGMVGFINSYISMKDTSSPLPTWTIGSFWKRLSLIPWGASFKGITYLGTFFPFIPDWESCGSNEFHGFRNPSSSKNLISGYHMKGL